MLGINSDWQINRINTDNPVHHRIGNLNPGCLYDVQALHGDISQAQREKTLHSFRILQATVLACAGVDL